MILEYSFFLSVRLVKEGILLTEIAVSEVILVCGYILRQIYPLEMWLWYGYMPTTCYLIYSYFDQHTCDSSGILLYLALYWKDTLIHCGIIRLIY